MSLDLSKPCQTKEGRPARLLSKDLKGERPLVWAVELTEKEHLYCTGLDGRWSTRGPDSAWDIVNAPPKKHVRYVNIYAKGATYVHSTRSEADQGAISQRIACVRVELEEGRFDD